MKAFEIFKKTMLFVWIRLGINLAVSAGVILWTVIWIAIAGAAENGFVYILALAAIISSGKIVGLIQQYIGYMIKSAQIAVVAEAFKSGKVPENMLEFGKERVKSRFAAANAYILLDKLVSGAVRQINNVVNKSMGLIENIIPQAEFLTKIIRKFTTVTLTYIDECCLCYTFMNDGQSAFKSAADGVVIYFQNWKALLKSSAKGTGIAIAVEAIAGIIVFLIAFAIVNLFDVGLAWIIALVAAICIVCSLRDAFLNSYMMIYTMENFNKEALTGRIAADLYGKLCGISAKFRELLEKGGGSGSAEPAMAYAASAVTDKSSGNAVYCKSCGANVSDDSRFCPECGKEI